MKATRLPFLLSVFLCSACSDTTLSPQDAIAKAIPAINRDFPGSNSRPETYSAVYDNGTWTVFPKLPRGVLGGGPSADVSDETGLVLRTFFSE